METKNTITNNIVIPPEERNVNNDTGLIGQVNNQQQRPQQREITWVDLINENALPNNGQWIG